MSTSFGPAVVAIIALLILLLWIFDLIILPPWIALLIALVIVIGLILFFLWIFGLVIEVDRFKEPWDE